MRTFRGYTWQTWRGQNLYLINEFFQREESNNESSNNHLIVKYLKLQAIEIRAD
jgi:hypothetical protein